jgi:hypothetical protein
MILIYILQLNENKYYVGKTNFPHFRLCQHFSGEGSCWTNKYNPIKVLELIKDCDDYDEDKYVKITMGKYGIDNVRGGSYNQIELSEVQIQLLQKELKTTQNICYNCGENGHFISECDKVDLTTYIEEFESISNIDNEIERLFKLLKEIPEYLTRIRNLKWIISNKFSTTNRNQKVNTQHKSEILPNMSLEELEKHTYIYGVNMCGKGIISLLYIINQLNITFNRTNNLDANIYSDIYQDIVSNKKQKFYKIILQKCYILRKEEENKCIDLIPEYSEFIKHIGEEEWNGTFTHKIKPLFLDKIVALQDKKIELIHHSM